MNDIKIPADNISREIYKLFYVDFIQVLLYDSCPQKYYRF